MYDHVLVFPAIAVDGFTAATGLHGEAVLRTYLLSWLLDHPLAAVDQTARVHRLDGSDWPVDEGLPGADLAQVFEHVGGSLQPLPPEATAGTNRRRLTLPADTAEIMASLAGLEPADRSRVLGAIESYARALLHAEPEPGFERYRDVNFAITQWMIVVEAMAEPVGSKEARVRALVNKISPETTPARVKELRDVRHVLAHEAARRAPDLFTSARDVFEREHRHLTTSGTREARALAHKAIRSFIARRSAAAGVMPS